MLSQVRPTTLSGIKTLASDLQRANCLTRSRALDAAARQAGYMNWGHARNEFSAQPTPPRRKLIAPCVPTWISIYWRDREAGRRGRETLRVELSCPFADLLTPQQLKICAFVGGMRLAAPDHLSEWIGPISQHSARWYALRAARTLQFLDATGLKPSRARSRVYPQGRSDLAPPGRDHASIWYDTTERHHIYVDEPYGGAVDREERRLWAETYGRTILKPRWTGMYNPDGGTEAYLISDTKGGYDLQRIAAAVDGIEPIPGEWAGESASWTEPFRTPASHY